MIRVDFLAYKCNTILLMLINLYEKSEINEDTFKDNSYLKIQFLASNLDAIEDEKTKDISIQILAYYKMLLEKDTASELACSIQV